MNPQESFVEGFIKRAQEHGLTEDQAEEVLKEAAVKQVYLRKEGGKFYIYLKGGGKLSNKGFFSKEEAQRFVKQLNMRSRKGKKK